MPHGPIVLGSGTHHARFDDLHILPLDHVEALSRSQQRETEPFVKFGIVTDVHYADADPEGTRVYRDSLPKMKEALASISSEMANFLIELGDFKDTDANQGCAAPTLPSQHCINITLEFLNTVESLAQHFNGSLYHVLGNHDVDILNQSAVLSREKNSQPLDQGGPGYYSWSFPAADNWTGADTDGCIVRDEESDSNVWIVHADGSRNWLSAPSPGCYEKALIIYNVSLYPKRHGGEGAYNLTPLQSKQVCNRPGPGPNCSTVPRPPSVHQGRLRFIVLNGDYTAEDVPWNDLNHPQAGEAWDKANVPSFQLEWLALQLESASILGQHVIVFVHYRLDGGPFGPVGKGLGPPCPASNRAWVDDCTLENAAVVSSCFTMLFEYRSSWFQ